ncbi:hypothetical protein LCGC14_2347750, partial [marine sediment metagenome]
YGIYLASGFGSNNEIAQNIILYNSQENLYVFTATYYDNNVIENNNINEPTIIRNYEASFPVGTTGHIITWTVYDTDILATAFTVFRNGTSVSGYQEVPWNSGQPLQINIDGLAVDTYNYTIIASDGWNGISQDEVIFEITNVAPNINVNVDNLIHEIGTFGHFITWVISDPSVLNPNYTVYLNSSPIGGFTNNSWTSGTDITINTDNLSLGSHNFTIIGSDGYGAIIEDQVIITVINTIPQVVVEVNNATYEVGSTGNYIKWIINDPSIFAPNYTVYFNNSPMIEYINNTWFSGIEITIDIDNLTLGIYNYTILLLDGYGASIQNEIIITVINTFPNIISSSEEIIYEFETIGNSISWHISDISVFNPLFTIYLDSIPLFGYENQTWSTSENVTVSVDNLVEGIYNYTIILSDGYGGVSQNQIIVNVIDNIAPYISSINFIEYIEGEMGTSITWIITDSDVYYPIYSIYRNGTFLISDSWISNQPIIFSIEGLIAGYYNYSIITYDGWGEFAQKDVLIRVKVNSIPIVTHSEEERIEYSESTTGHFITWNIADPDT